MPAQLHDGCEFTILIEGLMDRIGGGSVDDEHVGILQQSESE